jgi:hypothetical protein
MDRRTAHDVPSEHLVIVDFNTSLDITIVSYDRLGHRSRHLVL